ncbi:MAG: ABC transporter ATP-binding protein [Fibrobacterales bacterium]
MASEIIKSIKIENVKGIKSKCFDLGIIAKKPSIIVAPNGFGKSSLAVAFESLKTNKISLSKENSYCNEEQHNPILNIEYQFSDGSLKNYIADDLKNEITSEFDVHVINNKLKAKATTKNLGQYRNTTSMITVEDIVLIKTIPPKKHLIYSVSGLKKELGGNGKIFPNITELFKDHKLIVRAYNCFDFVRINRKRNVEDVDRIFSTINESTGTKESIIQELDTTLGDLLQKQYPLNSLWEVVRTSKKCPTNRVDVYLTVLVLYKVLKSNSAEIKAAVKYSKYVCERMEFDQVFSFIKCTWKGIKPKEDKKKGLIISFPGAHQISNGERDVITFIASLYRAKRKWKKSKCILIIDEVFDYLDDANLIAVQYHVTQMINDMNKNGKIFYPIILTHLDPVHFKTFCFQNQKIYHLNKQADANSSSLLKIIRNREKVEIKNYIATYMFHYHPEAETVDYREHFQALALKETWGKASVFNTYLVGQLKKYVEGKENFDSLAVCCAVRVLIEKKIYNLLGEEHKIAFLEMHGTNKKLGFVEECGVDVPEVFAMLGIIYNSVLHIRSHSTDIVTPLVSKLQNLTIRTMISTMHHW